MYKGGQNIMGYKTIKEDFPEYAKKHELHMHELREKHKENEKKMTARLLGSKEDKKMEADYD